MEITLVDIETLYRFFGISIARNKCYDSFVSLLNNIFKDHYGLGVKEGKDSRCLDWYPEVIDTGQGNTVAVAFRAKASELLTDEVL